MARKEKFGKFILLEHVDTTALGQEFRAAKLGSTGLEKIVSVLKLNPALSASAEAAKSLMDQVKFAAQLQNPNVLKIYGIGKLESAYYVSSEFLESKSLKHMFARCREEGFPFSVDHALLIVSKVCSALEFAHGRRTEGGSRYFHGQLTPGSVVVSYEGEVRVRDFGVWPSRIRATVGSAPEEAGYLAPEQAAGGDGDTRSDIYAVGSLLFEMLTGEPLAGRDGRGDAAARVAGARLQNPTGSDDSLPRPIADILCKSLAADPGARCAEIQEMRKAVDTLLFSGDFTPTTFNLAFFMHSLFREEIERETRTLKEDKEASYLEYLTDEPARPRLGAAAAVSKPAVRDTPSRPVDLRSVLGGKAETTLAQDTAPTVALSVREAPVAAVPATARAPIVAQAPATIPAPAPASKTEPSPSLGSFTFHKVEPKSKTGLIAAAAAGVLLFVGAGGWLALRVGSTAPPAPVLASPPALTAEALAAAARIEELEEKLKQMEAEREAAEAKAADEARRKLQQQAVTRGQAVDLAAIQRAQDEARRKAEDELVRRQEEERRRLEEERQAEEARLAEQRRRAEEEAARQAAAATTLPAPPPPPAAPALRPGQLVDINELGVIAPVVQRRVNPVYPQIALRQRVEGTVELSVLVDESGNVVETRLVSGAAGRAGLNEAAIESVRKRKYRPATKDGVPVKVWLPVRVEFRLPS